MLPGLFGLGIPVIAGHFVQKTQRVMRREQTLLPEWADVGRVLRMFRVHWRDTVVIALIGIALSALSVFGLLVVLMGVRVTTFCAYLVMAYLSGQLHLTHTHIQERR